MHYTAIKSSLLLGASLFFAPGMVAQETETEARQETVIVTGTPIRDSQAAALEAKRAAPNVVDIISADTIGRFPDQNLADSLNRLPGLAVERDQGQARYINFRGAPRRFTAIAFDGIDVPGAENGRIPRFDSFPSVIVSAVEANKAITPDMPGEAVAGFINLKTFDPFTSEGLSFSLEGGFGEQDLGGGDVERYNGRLSFSNDQFGFVVFGSHNGRDQITDNREFDVVNGAFETVEFRSYLVERQDNAYGGRVEFRGEGALDRLFLSSIYSEFIDDELRNQFNFAFDASGEAFVFSGGTAADTFTGPVQPGQTGFDPFIGVTRALQDGRYQNSTFTNTLGADLSFGDWAMMARLNYTETENSTDLILPFSTFSAISGSFDFTDVNNPRLELQELFTGTPTTQQGVAYFADLIIPVLSELDIEAWQAKLDAERDITLFGRDHTLKLGGKYDTREATGFDTYFTTVSAPSGVDFSSFDTGQPWDTGFSNTIGGTVYDSVGLLGALRTAGADFDLTIPADLFIGIEEDIFSTYAMVTTDYDWGNVVLGARIEATDFSSSGNAVFTGPGGTPVVSPISASNDYVHILPSAHVNIDLAPDHVLRFSLSTGVSRPTYIESRASVAVDATSIATGGRPTLTGGNPNLDAEFAWGGDVSYEFYFDDASLFSVAAYARRIDNVIYSESIPLADVSGFDPANIAAGTPGDFVSFANGQDGELYGLEVNFIGQASSLFEGPLDGFGVEGSVTVLDSSFTIPSIGGRAARELSLPGTSETIFGASLFYEKYGLSARVNYQYRDDWLDETESTGADVFWDEQERVDASIRYTIPRTIGGASVTLFADGNNLTDSVDVRYTNTDRTPNQVEGYGARYLVGLRIDY